MKNCRVEYISLVLVVALLISVGCGTEGSEGSNDRERFGGSEAEFPENQEPFDFDGVAMPIVTNAGEADGCYPTSYPAPSLEFWLAASTSVFVGTVDRVEIVDHPYLLHHRYEDGPNEQTLGSKDDCIQEPGPQLVDVYFKDVEILHGEELGDEIKIRVTWENLHWWQIGPVGKVGEEVSWSSWSDAEIWPFYRGARLGGSVLRSPRTDMLTFQFRLFQIIEEEVVLQEYIPRLEERLLAQPEPVCIGVPLPPAHLHIDHDGREWVSFREEIKGLEIDREALRETSDHLDNYIRRSMEEPLDEVLNHRRIYYPHCLATTSELPEDSWDGDREDDD